MTMKHIPALRAEAPALRRPLSAEGRRILAADKPRMWANLACSAFCVSAILAIATGAAQYLLAMGGYHYDLTDAAMIAEGPALVLATYIGLAVSISENDNTMMCHAMAHAIVLLEDAQKSVQGPNPEVDRLKREIRTRSTRNRRTIMRLAAVANGLDRTLRSDRIENEDRMKAKSLSYVSAIEIARETAPAIDEANGVDVNPMATLTAICDAAVRGDLQDTGGASPIGNARIGRILANAEKALAVDPDLMDDAGSRIDDLVRKHLPRLMQRHAEASKVRPVEELASIDADLDEAVELVRASVEEALSRLKDASRDALRNEIGFLRLRRGDPSLQLVKTA